MVFLLDAHLKDLNAFKKDILMPQRGAVDLSILFFSSGFKLS